MTFPNHVPIGNSIRSETLDSTCSNCQIMYHREQAFRNYQEILESRICQTEASHKELADYLMELQDALSGSRYVNCDLEARLASVCWEKECLRQSLYLEKARAKEMELRLAILYSMDETVVAGINWDGGHREDSNRGAQGNPHFLSENKQCGTASEKLESTIESWDITMQQFTEALSNTLEQVRYIRHAIAEEQLRCISGYDKDAFLNNFIDRH